MRTLLLDLRRPALLAAFVCAALGLASPASRAGEIARAAAGAHEAAARETLPEGMKIASLAVRPDAIEIADRFAYRQVLLTGRLESGEEVDVTRMAEVSGAGGVVEVSARGLVRPLADGEATLVFTLGGLSAALPVRVSGQTAERAVSFVQDVMPVISRIGCNAGTCHGAAQGKNGFKLTLRGYDPALDHISLTDDLQGRRFNRAVPDRSLFLLKVSGGVPHVGGVHTQPGEPYYEILRRWVAGGAQLDLGSPRVDRIEVFPSASVLPLPGMSQQMAVLATYTDGRVRDVTAESFFETSNTEVTAVEPHGRVTALRRGEAAVLVRYEGRYAAASLIVMGDRSGFEWQEVAEHNYIDTLVYEKLRRVKSLPSALSTDAEFLRRVYLDLTGIPPTPQEVRTFLMDRRETRLKRDEVVERLIGSVEFVEFWTNKWADLLQVNRRFLGPEGAAALREWIRAAVASDMPYDRFVHAVLTASGSTLQNPPAAYYKVLRQPEDVMENTTQLFLGVRFSCNKCHDHPFERWTQGNYWELASYFAQVGRKDAPGSPKMPRESAPQEEVPAFEEIIFDAEKGEVKAPTGGVVNASFPYRHEGKVPDEGTRRERLAAWLTSERNPYFAKSFVNRIWSYFLGAGLIDPVDDVRAGNPPTNPALLERLTADFIAQGFDTRHLMRLIAKSRVYQHSIETNRWNEDDSINFSHALARRLPAETLYDALHRATGSRSRLPSARPGTRAAELLDSSVKLADDFLDLFGKPPRESACECERTSGMSLGHALNLVNGPTVAEAIRDPQNRIGEIVAFERDNGKVADELFLAFISRPPTEEERKSAMAAMDPRDKENLACLLPEEKEAALKDLEGWEKSQSFPEWTLLRPAHLASKAGMAMTQLNDGAILVAPGADKDTYTVAATTDLKGITGIRLEVLPDERLPGKGPGLADNGNFVLTELTLVASPAGDPAAERKIALQNASATFEQEGLPAALAADGKVDDKGWAIAPRLGRRHLALFELKEDAGVEGGTLLRFTLEHQFGGKHALGKFRLWVTDAKRPVKLPGLPEDIVEALRTAPPERTPGQEAALFRQFLSTRPDIAEKIRLNAAQDLAWAFVNSPAFLFNR